MHAHTFQYFYYFSAHTSSVQRLLLVLCSRICPGSTWELYMVTRTEPEPAAFNCFTFSTISPTPNISLFKKIYINKLMNFWKIELRIHIIFAVHICKFCIFLHFNKVRCSFHSCRKNNIKWIYNMHKF